MCGHARVWRGVRAAGAAGACLLLAGPLSLAQGGSSDHLLPSHPFSCPPPLIPRQVGILHEVDCFPSYFIVGGLVFVPLSLPVLEAAYSTRKWRTLAPVSVLSAFQEQRTDPSQQVVILLQV